MEDFKNCCESIVKTGFGRIGFSVEMKHALDSMIANFESIDSDVKLAYCFEDETDGFLSFGSEFSRVKENPDLCQRFCYWHAHADARKNHWFGKREFLNAAAEYESRAQEVSKKIIDGICREFDVPTLASTRMSSYLQLCLYGEITPDPRREFAQDPHEDGHLLSLIRPSTDGLVRVYGRTLKPVRLLEDEIAVLAGALLSKLSDYSIPAVYHAVLMPVTPKSRNSMVYFVNPDPNEKLRSFVSRNPIDLNQAMNERHVNFGNKPLIIN